MSSAKSTTKVCGNCNIKHSSAELSGPQQLCKECRRTLPQSKCTFCCIDFYVTGSLNKTKPACKKCSEYYNKFGDPKTCDWCKSPSAFKGSKCFQCKSAEEKYGKPSRCEGCKNTAYFDKGLEAKKKVDNKALCLLCTLKYKKELHRSGKFKRSSKEIVDPSSAKPPRSKRSKEDTSTTSTKRKETKDSEVQVDLCGHGMEEEKAGPTTDNKMEAILLTTQLKEEIAQLKRQLDIRDRSMIEKGKQYNELKTEMWETDKKLKKRLTDQAIEHDKRIENMTSIISEIKAQNNKLSRQVKASSGVRKSTPPVSMLQTSLLEPDARDSS